MAAEGSSCSEEALKYTRELALRHDAQTVVVHALELVSAYLGEPWLHRVMACHFAAGREVADQAARDLQEAGIGVEVEVLEGPPADAILRVSEVRQCDLILMGSRGRGTLASLLLGSVLQRVLSHASIPVMVVSAKAMESNQRVPSPERPPA